MRISDWSSDVCSSDLRQHDAKHRLQLRRAADRCSLFKLGIEPVHGMAQQGISVGNKEQRHDGNRAPVADDVQLRQPGTAQQDRKSVVEGKGVSVRVDLGGRRIIKKKKKKTTKK